MYSPICNSWNKWIHLIYEFVNLNHVKWILWFGINHWQNDYMLNSSYLFFNKHLRHLSVGYSIVQQKIELIWCKPYFIWIHTLIDFLYYMNSLINPIGYFIMAFHTKNKSWQQVIDMGKLHFHCRSNCYDLRRQLTCTPWQKFTDNFLGNTTLNY